MPGFVGREHELTTLDGLCRAEMHDERAAVAVINGMPGVGKTSLAVHWAHRIAHSFDDGQLYAQLAGYGAGGPVDPSDVLAGFLTALGVPEQEVPRSLDERAAMFRTHLVDRRVLLLLDNAATVDQVRPLLPASRAAVVLVTSRHALPELEAFDGATRLDLAGLADEDGVCLLTGVAGSAVGDVPLAAELVRRCAGLPLALRLAAGLLTRRAALDLGAVVDQLAGNSPLDVLHLGECVDTPVRAAFHLSYERLTAAQQRLFRRLAVVPGPDFAPGAATALIGDDSADELLGSLVHMSLVEPVRPRRFRLHDLLRHYAAERLADQPAEERAAALERLYSWYLTTADSAARQGYPRLLHPQRRTLGLPDEPTTTFDGPDQARDWLITEMTSVVAAIRMASTDVHVRPMAWKLAGTLRGVFPATGDHADWLATVQAALPTAEDDGDILGQAIMCRDQARALCELGRYAEAREGFGRTYDLAVRASWTAGTMSALVGLGNVDQWLDKHEAAIRYYRRLYDLSTEAGHPKGRAVALNGMGISYRFLGQTDRALAALREAFDIAERHDGSGSHNHLWNQGDAHCDAGRLPEAARMYEAALARCRRDGAVVDEPSIMLCLAVVLRDMGAPDVAVSLCAPAREAVSTVCSPVEEARLLIGLTRVAEQADRDDLERAFELADGVGARHVAVDALIAFADLEAAADQAPEAHRWYGEARWRARAIGYRHGEATALLGLGEASVRLGNRRAGTAYWEQAYSITTEAGFAILTARSYCLRAELYAADGQFDRAVNRARRALAGFSAAGHQEARQRTAARLTWFERRVFRPRFTRHSPTRSHPTSSHQAGHHTPALPRRRRWRDHVGRRRPDGPKRTATPVLTGVLANAGPASSVD